MDKIYCEKCGEELAAGVAAHGLTSGRINPAVEGFEADDNGWEVICPKCALEIYAFLGGGGKAAELLKNALQALNTAPKFNVDFTTSYRIAADIEKYLKQ